MLSKKIISLLLGTIFTFALFELFISLLASHHRLAKPIKHQTRNNKKEKIILCIGNSFTVGGGAPIGKSYPDQLQELFNKSNYPYHVKVLNYGVSIVNSAQILRKLSSYLNETTPDLVILRTGGPNRINHTFLNDYLERTGQLSSSLSIKLYDLLRFSHTFKLFSMLYLKYTSPHLTTPSSNITMEDLQPILDFHYSTYVENCNIHNQIQIKQEINFLYNLKAKYPLTSSILQWIGAIYQECLHDANKAFSYYTQGILLAPYYQQNPNYQRLITLVIEAPSLENKFKIFQKRFNTNFPQLTHRLVPMSSQLIEQWIKSDLKEMIHLIHQHGSKVLLHNYPPTPPPELNTRLSSQAIRSYALQHQIPFLDLEKKFLQYFLQHDPAQYYATIMGKFEGHINAYGYHQNAQWLKNIIDKKKLLMP